MEAVQVLREIEELKKLKARYYLAVDAKRADDFKALFTPDATFETSAGVRSGPDEIVSKTSVANPGVVTIHHGHMPIIDIVSATEATGIWATGTTFVSTLDDGRQQIRHLYGHHYYEYVKVEGAWLIRRLRFVPQWSEQ